MCMKRGSFSYIELHAQWLMLSYIEHNNITTVTMLLYASSNTDINSSCMHAWC